MANFRSLVPGGFFGNGTSGPVSIRANNPGAINGAAWERSYPGFVENIKYDGVNDTTVFETPEYGVAAWWNLMRLYRAGGTTTVMAIVNRYGGGQDYSAYARTVAKWAELTPAYEIKLEGSDDDNLLKFAKAMFRYEAGQPTPLSDAQIMLGFRLGRNGGHMPDVAPPTWAPASALPTDDLAAKIIVAVERRGAKVDRGAGQINIIYVEGMDPDGKANGHIPNHFDDLRCLIRLDGGVPRIVGKWDATTRPGKFWTDTPMDSEGAFHIALGQQRAWVIGTYHDMPALRQELPIDGTRDAKHDYERDGPQVNGVFGIHHHGGYDYPHDELGRSSAGCLVGRSMAGHREFMALVATDSRYQDDDSFVFSATVLTAAEVLVTATSSSAPPPPADPQKPDPQKPDPQKPAAAHKPTLLSLILDWLKGH